MQSDGATNRLPELSELPLPNLEGILGLPHRVRLLTRICSVPVGVRSWGVEDTAVSSWNTRRPDGKTGQNQPANKYAGVLGKKQESPALREVYQCLLVPRGV